MARAAQAAATSPKGDDRFRSQFKKTELCVFFGRGWCQKGDHCNFAHGAEELQAAPDLTKTSLCQKWLKHQCKRSSDVCPFAHGPAELRVTKGYVQVPSRRKCGSGKGAGAQRKTGSATRGVSGVTDATTSAREAAPLPPVAPVPPAFTTVCLMPPPATITSAPAALPTDDMWQVEEVAKKSELGATACPLPQPGDQPAALPACSCAELTAMLTGRLSGATPEQLLLAIQQALPDHYED